MKSSTGVLWYSYIGNLNSGVAYQYDSCNAAIKQCNFHHLLYK